MSSFPIENDAASSDPPPSGKFRRGPKPSSKKRLETFRFRKSSEAQQRIHKEAFDETNISLDALLLALNDLQLGSAKQVSEIPITTRGVGLLTNECHQRATTQVPRSAEVCDVNTLYRVSLAQQQMQLHQSQECNLLPDPTFRQIEVQDLSLDPSLAQEVRGMDQNFAVTADLINATGVVEVHQQTFTPFIPAMNVAAVEPMQTATPKRKRSVELLMVPDPYTVTFNNLKKTVNALSNEETPVAIRQYFRDHNPIPGATFDEDGLLLNPNTIIPPLYERASLKRDLRDASAYFALLGSKMTSLMGKCAFTGRGAPSQLCGYYKERFFCNRGDVYSPEHARVRCARPVETTDMVRGALNLLGETPIDGLERDSRQFAFREPVNQVQFIDLDWSGLVTRCLVKR